MKYLQVTANTQIITKEKIIEYMNAFGLTNLTDKEKTQFIEIAQAYQLNPFKKEIHCVPYETSVKDENGQWKKERKLSIIIGYETYLKRAERCQKLNGWKCWTEGKISDNSLKAVIEIHRKDWEKPFIHEVWLIEYRQDNKMWNTKPITMIKKVCTAQAFRLAFPDDMGGMPYIEEELPPEMTVEPVREPEGMTFESIMNIITNAQTADELASVIGKAKELPANEKKLAKDAYTKKLKELKVEKKDE